MSVFQVRTILLESRLRSLTRHYFSMKDRHGLLTAPIGRVLLNMSLPNLIGIMTILGFSLADTFLSANWARKP